MCALPRIFGYQISIPGYLRSIALLDVGMGCETGTDEVLGERFCPLSNTNSQASRPVDVSFRIRSPVRPAFILSHALLGRRGA